MGKDLDRVAKNREKTNRSIKMQKVGQVLDFDNAHYTVDLIGLLKKKNVLQFPGKKST